MLEIAATDTLYNLNSLNNISRGNKEFIAKMIEIFIEQTTDVIEKVEIAISQNDFIEVSRLIHKIRPGIESLGIITITKEMQLLEKTAKTSNDKEKISALFFIIRAVLEKAIIQLTIIKK